MGGGGFSWDAVKVIRANRALLKKRRSYKDIRAEYEDLTSKTQVKFKELSPEQQKRIKEHIRKRARKEKLHNLWLTVTTTLVILALMIFLYIRYMA